MKLRLLFCAGKNDLRVSERERVTVVCNMRVNRAELKIRYLNNNLKLFVSIDMTV